MSKRWSLLLLVAAASIVPNPAWPSEQVLDLNHWKVVKTGATFRGTGPVMRVSGGKGWAHATMPVMDFVVRLEFRALTPDAEGAVVVRGGVLDADTWPAFGYRISIADPTNAKVKLGAVKGYRRPVRSVEEVEPQAPRGVSETGKWHQLLISCEEDVVTVSLDGVKAEHR